MSQCADEIAAVAWPDLLVSVQAWDPEAARWHDLGPWDARVWGAEIALGDPLPLIAVHTLCKWIVPATDGDVWWWTRVSKRPDAVPIFSKASGAASDTRSYRVAAPGSTSASATSPRRRDASR